MGILGTRIGSVGHTYGQPYVWPTVGLLCPIRNFLFVLSPTTQNLAAVFVMFIELEIELSFKLC